jgi:PAS domain S-box-containing protein
MKDSKPTYEDLEKQIIELKSERKLKQTVERLEEFFNLSPSLMVITNPEGEVFKINKSCKTILGYTEKEISKIGLWDLVHPDDIEKTAKVIEEQLKGNPIINLTNRNKCKDGSYRTLEWQATLIKDGFTYASANDITEQNEAVEELRKAKEKAEESERLISAFLANMSHEIRTPMNGVLGFAQLLKRKNISAEKREKYLDLMDHEGKRLLNIISDIVDISKIDSNSFNLDFSSCNVNALIDGLYSKYSISTMSSNIKLKAKKGLEDKDSTIETDSNRLIQILSNLIENALKFTKGGFVKFGYSLSSNELKFYVKDSGPGIDAEDHQAIFGRFIQGKQHNTHESGSGLGLSIAKGLTRLLGGDVWVESETGIGSTFFVTIPYTNASSKTEDVEPNKCSTLLTKRECTILIAEDEFINFMYLEECLSDFNCTILHAYNGKEAVKIFEETAAIDFILMDINMPEMNGYEAFEIIRKKNKDVPIIALTGLAMSGDKEKILKAGFDDYISKPVSGDLLITTLSKHSKRKLTLLE